MFRRFFYFWEMKKHLLLFAIFTFLYLFIQAQEVNIKGKWKVNCPLEKNENGTLHVCDLCPRTMLNNNAAIVEDFVLEFTDETIKLDHEEVPIEIAYKFDKNTNRLRFKYLQKEYVFKVMIVSDPFVHIMIAESGEVLYLKKIL